jgi:hypothetical protein
MKPIVSVVSLDGEICGGLSEQSYGARNWVEFYASGATRVLSTRGLSGNPNLKLEDLNNETYMFSDTARRRFYRLLNSVDTTDIYSFFATFTFSDAIPIGRDNNLCLQSYRTLLKRFHQCLVRSEMSAISKTEFHRSGFPHLHSLIFLKKGVISFYEKNSITGKDGLSLHHLRIYLSNLWVDCVDQYVYSLPLLSIFEASYLSLWLADSKTVYPVENKEKSIRLKMLQCNMACQIIKDYKKAVAYLSNYLSRKDKEYQNLIPYNFRGLRFTTKAKGFLKFQDPVHLMIPDDLYYKLGQIYVMRCKEKYGKDYVVKNGFYLDDIEKLLSTYNECAGDIKLWLARNGLKSGTLERL